MSGKQKRRTFSVREKVAIVKRHLIDGVPVSDLCEEQQIQPTLFYQWQKQLFENGAAAFVPITLMDRADAYLAHLVNDTPIRPRLAWVGPKSYFSYWCRKTSPVSAHSLYRIQDPGSTHRPL